MSPKPQAGVRWVFAESEAIEDLDARACLEQYRKVNQEIDQNEKDFRKAVRDEEERLRKIRVSQVNPAKRRAIQERSNQRAADHDAQLRQLRRLHGL